MRAVSGIACVCVVGGLGETGEGETQNINALKETLGQVYYISMLYLSLFREKAKVHPWGHS